MLGCSAQLSSVAPVFFYFAAGHGLLFVVPPIIILLLFGPPLPAGGGASLSFLATEATPSWSAVTTDHPSAPHPGAGRGRRAPGMYPPAPVAPARNSSNPRTAANPRRKRRASGTVATTDARLRAKGGLRRRGMRV